MLVKFNFLSKALMQQTNVTMILPSWTLFDDARGKATSYQPGTKFQVLYLYHGGTGDDSDYVNFSNILRYADDHKIAVVMPDADNSSYKNQPDDVLPWPARYWEYIFEELPKVCAAMFPISTKPEDTFVGGLSMGSMAATKWAVYGPERCAGALIMSGGGMETTQIMSVVSQSAKEGEETDFVVDVDAMKAQGIKFADPDSLLFKTAKANAKSGKKLPKLFMTCGGDDFIRIFAQESRDLFLAYGYDVQYDEVPGYAHEWDFWDLSLRKALDEWLPIRHEVILPE
ncbi:MAG: putative tributyrin esterase [Clostridiales bacterium]|jgi:S-formylglutathione hydrolase FrmB|nr:putative tributyrin esterase [Clostridiales bacterium]